MARTPRSNFEFLAFSSVAALLGALTIAVQALGATPVGSEFQVNTYTAPVVLVGVRGPPPERW